jgi:inorganic pyrophosphatase
MVYPANYGFIPQTLCDDGDPCDALVITQVPAIPLPVVRRLPLGVLVMTDERGPDEKLLLLQWMNLYYMNIRSLYDLPTIILHEHIAHFFTHYKDLEKGKWANVSRWMETEEAQDYIVRSIARPAVSA